MPPDIYYRDPSDGEFKEVSAGGPGPVGPPGPTGPTGPDGGVGPPIGSVTMYGGSTAPPGWHLCDGTAHGSAALEAWLGSANAPDLRDKFIIGTGPAHVAKSTGGAATVTLTAAQSGSVAHTHAASRSHAHTVDPPNTNTVSALGNHQHLAYSSAFALTTGSSLIADGGHSNYYYVSAYASPTTAKSLAHTHTVNIPSFASAATVPTVTVTAVAAANATAAHENLPPFWALTYIIRTV